MSCCTPGYSDELDKEIQALNDGRALDQVINEAALRVSGFEVEKVNVCGLDLRIMRRRTDYFKACAGDLPIASTGLVLWECAQLLADYVGYARWLDSGFLEGDDGSNERPWWQLHLPAPVVPCRFWGQRSVLELGGGCGMVTAVLASLGARVVCTDGDPAALRTAARNAAEARRQCGGTWGEASFKLLRWGDAAAMERVLKECGPFEYIIGSDLLYGEKSPPEPLVETLASCFQAQVAPAALVMLALKNRMLNEVGAFCEAAEARGLWDVSLANREDMLEGFDGRSGFTTEDVPAYSVVLLKAKSAASQLETPEPTAKRLKSC